MAVKKKIENEATPAEAAGANWKFLLKWLFILGGLFTGITNAMAINADYQLPDALIWVSVAIAVIVGLFYFDSSDFTNIGLRFLVFNAAARSIPGESEYVAYATAFLMGFAFYLGPIVLTDLSLKLKRLS